MQWVDGEWDVPCGSVLISILSKSQFVRAIDISCHHKLLLLYQVILGHREPSGDTLSKPTNYRGISTLERLVKCITLFL